DRRQRDAGRLELALGLAQLVQAGTDLERNMIESGGGLAGTAAFAAYFHDGKLVMIAEREERHLHAVLVVARAERQAQHTAIEFLGTVAIGDPQNDMTQGFDLHFATPNQ